MADTRQLELLFQEYAMLWRSAEYQVWQDDDGWHWSVAFKYDDGKVSSSQA